MTERKAQEQAAAPQPIRWRLALLTWFAAFVTALVVFIVGGPELNRMNVVLRALIVTGILVGVIQYVALPLIFKYGRPVLFPHAGPPDAAPRAGDESRRPA
jgi:antibiotic biosynthesis monooxygenase (ABM) superfamily enzyme